MADLAGCGAVQAVTRGNVKDSDFLVKLSYSPDSSEGMRSPAKSATIGQLFTSSFDVNTKEGRRPVVLVGKGVCYDTGGLNLKSADAMRTMKHDMAGSAAALGLFYALRRMNSTFAVECWLILVENNVNTESFRPDEVVTAVTGDSIEVVHTDAEGRMILADVLALASRRVSSPLISDVNCPPRLLLDFATLTGTCITSLSTRYIGAFTSRRDMASKIIDSGDQSGERAWPFPYDEDFDKDLDSDVADVLQCRQATIADHIYAFAFLRRFVRSHIPWVHLDLASSHRSEGFLGHVPSPYTGAGVRFGFQLIENMVSSK